ncbi:uncharacterized protein [Ptychodera flava]|uniref:uncharacterized protein n=1 Tax=Ptychodera flava TaxID=63121 RepID=UPI00396A3F37
MDFLLKTSNNPSSNGNTMAEELRHNLEDSTTVDKVDENSLCCVVGETVAKIGELIRNVKEQMTVADDFVATAPKCLSPIIGLYASAFAKLNVTSQEDFLELFKSYHSYANVRDVYEELIEAEDLWEKTLQEFDEGLRKGDSRTELTIGSAAPSDIPVTDLKTNRTLTLNDLVGKQNLLLVFMGHSA